MTEKEKLKKVVKAARAKKATLKSVCATKCAALDKTIKAAREDLKNLK